MAENADAGLLARAPADLVGHDGADSPQPRFANGARVPQRDEVAPGLARALGHDHQREPFAVRLPVGDGYATDSR